MDSKHMILSDWEDYAHNLGGELITEMDAVTYCDRWWLVLPEIDGQQNDECELLTDDYGDHHYVYQVFLDDYRDRILKKLATEHPDCLSTHKDIKNLAPLSVLKSLLDAGYQDVSYGNDECPSYYLEIVKEGGDVCERYIYIYDDVNEDGERVSEVVKFKVRDESEIYPSEEVGVFDTIEEAIEGGEA